MNHDLQRAVIELLECLDLEAVEIDWETERVPVEESPSDGRLVEYRRTGGLTITVKGRTS